MSDSGETMSVAWNGSPVLVSEKPGEETVQTTGTGRTLTCLQRVAVTSAVLESTMHVRKAGDGWSNSKLMTSIVLPRPKLERRVGSVDATCPE